MTYQFKCTGCGERFDVHGIPMQKRDSTTVLCRKCGAECKRVIQDSMSFQIAETSASVSVKPDSYWKNAEWNRKKNQKKKQEAEKERLRYDHKYRNQKLEAQARKHDMAKKGEGFEYVKPKKEKQV